MNKSNWKKKITFFTNPVGIFERPHKLGTRMFKENNYINKQYIRIRLRTYGSRIHKISRQSLSSLHRDGAWVFVFGKHYGAVSTEAVSSTRDLTNLGSEYSKSHTFGINYGFIILVLFKTSLYWAK